MQPEDIVDLGRHAMMIALLVAAPLLIAGALAGLVVGVFQTLTQVQDHTLAFVVKLVVVVIVAVACLPWLIQKMSDYTGDAIRNTPTVVFGE